jgi:hypothetical protein
MGQDSPVSSDSDDALAYGKSDEVGFIMDIQFLH